MAMEREYHSTRPERRIDRAAFVVDGQLVRVHKIRTGIDGGRIQITRCTDRACESILTKLVERRDAGR